MTHSSGLTRVALLAILAHGASADALVVSSISPQRNLVTAPTASSISVTFDQPVNAATVSISSFRAYGRWSGPVRGAYTFSSGNRTVTLTPNHAFTAGETVTVNLANSLAAADGSRLRSAGYAWQFITRTGAGTRSFDLIDTMSNSLNGEHTQLYGAFAADLDHNGWLDLVTVNEVSTDLRRLFNRSDGSGLFFPVALPVTPVGVEASPNATADLNNDGEVDAAIVNATDSTVSILLGDGQAAFLPQVVYATAAGPHGVTLLDVNGDGAWDMVTSGYDGNKLWLRINDGSGGFGAPTIIEGGGDGEWPVASGDFNNDGILDLVVGLANSQQVAILLGNGDATFAAPRTFAAGGFTWKFALGDVNGDGNLDVSVANGGTATGAILLGDGSGNLGTATIYNTGGSLVASDLGDLDGDGHLDWVLSSYSAGQSYIYYNNGNGVFTFDQALAAQSAASCAVLFDFDNDSDLDIATFDEIADKIKLYRNRGNPNETIFADGFENTPRPATTLAASP